MASDLIATGLQDDPDPEGCDVYGMLPLLAELEDDSDDNDSDDERDDSGADDEESEPPLIEPSSIEIEVPEGTEFDDDDEAFQALTAGGATDMFPGEARELIKYMRPLTDEEEEIAEDPYLNDLRWTDDPAHIDDVLKAGKGDHGLDAFLDDATYGDIHMKTPEERAERRGNDKNLRFVATRPRQNARPSSKQVARLVNATVVVGLSKKLTVEHANWLAEKDKSAGVQVRPRAFYENVGKLWARQQLKDARIPTSSSGNWHAHPKKIAAAADRVLVATSGERSRFSPTLGDQVDMGWWNPVKAIKSAAKSIEHGVAKGAGLAYKGARFAVTKPFVYTYKGVRYVGKLAQKIALAPLRAIINRFTNTMVNRRANYIAKQRGAASPTSDDRARAKAWAKSYVRSHNRVYGPVISSLMGNERGYDPGYGMRAVDLSFDDSGNDLMGLGTAGIAGLILLGPIGLVAILTGLVKASSPSAPPPTPENDASATQAAADADASDPGATDPGASDAADPGAEDPGTYDDGSADSSGRQSSFVTSHNQMQSTRQQMRSHGVTIEQLNAMPPKRRAKIQQSIRQGRIRLA